MQFGDRERNESRRAERSEAFLGVGAGTGCAASEPETVSRGGGLTAAHHTRSRRSQSETPHSQRLTTAVLNVAVDHFRRAP
jgi:hypothetical protein